VRNGGPGCRESLDRVVVEMHAVSEPYVLAQPAQFIGVFGRGLAELLLAVVLLVERLG
jgi:hypothetical protein